MTGRKRPESGSHQVDNTTPGISTSTALFRDSNGGSTEINHTEQAKSTHTDPLPNTSTGNENKTKQRQQQKKNT